MFPSVNCILLIFLLNYTCYAWANGSNLDHEAGVNSTLPRRFRQSGRYIIKKPKVREVLITEYKFMVAVTATWTPANVKKCSGVFIAKPSFVLTSATCVTEHGTSVPEGGIKIRYDTRISNLGGKVTGDAALKLDGEAPLTYLENNAAVIVTKEPITGSYAEPLPINLNDYYTEEFDALVAEKVVCTVLGFGIAPNGDPTKRVLTALDINLIDNEQCGKMLSNIGKTDLPLWDKVCAFTRGIDPCHGDGGQLLKCPRLSGPAGIFAFGKECGQENGPAVFTRIDKLTYDFIKGALARASPHSKSSSSWNRFDPALVGTISALLIIADIKKRLKKTTLTHKF